ncbi:hypothetical protein E2C01_067937 [Portunus trituberculatus]|uniref:Uncharacterized protein n=1 Tax=Portunus trituberculatus TaxID=210409 RepID=A0A5B7HQN5_PORTR|nr:hypothetical protein [Portunus trituberculatus]
MINTSTSVTLPSARCPAPALSGAAPSPHRILRTNHGVADSARLITAPALTVPLYLHLKLNIYSAASTRAIYRPMGGLPRHEEI